MRTVGQWISAAGFRPRAGDDTKSCVRERKKLQNQIRRVQVRVPMFQHPRLYLQRSLMKLRCRLRVFWLCSVVLQKIAKPQGFHKSNTVKLFLLFGLQKPLVLYILKQKEKQSSFSTIRLPKIYDCHMFSTTM